MKDKEHPQKIERHSLTVRAIHWNVTVSVILLIVSGIGQMPMYKRYMIDQLPGMAWSSDFSVTLGIHYLAAAVLLFAGIYHLTYHILRKEFNILPRRGDIIESYHIIKAILTGGQEPPSHKFLAEQRVAYLYIVISISLTIITGIFKVIKNFPDISFSGSFLYWVTTLHNIGTIMVVFGVAAHLGAFIVKENRKLLPSMFTGKVDLEYVKHRHTLWYKTLYPDTSPNKEKVDYQAQNMMMSERDKNIPT